MKKTTQLFLFILLLWSFSQGLHAQENLRLSNDRYSVEYSTSIHQIEVTEISSGRSRVFLPEFQVIYRASKPSISLTSINTLQDFEFKVVGYGGALSLFSPNAGTFTFCKPQSASLQNNSITVTYGSFSKFELAATISLPPGDEDVKIESSLKTLSAGYFSVGYYGAPELNRGEVSELFQPLPFTGLRVPAESYLTPAFLATIPGTFLTVGPITYGVYADPAEFPFNPLPCTLERSPFGVAIRNQTGVGKELKPMVWAPIMGNANSQFTANQTQKFACRLFVSQSNLTTAYENIARRSFGFGNFRNNDLGSLNKVLHRMIDYAMTSQWGVFKDKMKGCSYDTDVVGSVKNTSALPMYAAAFVADNQAIFEKRAMPVLEFLLSRENTMFAYDETGGAGGQTATNSLGKPCMNVSEMLSFYNITGKSMNAMLDMALINRRTPSISHETSLKENFSFYRATGASSYMSVLVDGANKYIQEEIDTKPTDFFYINHSKASFWSQIAPKFVELYEVYKTTGDKKYLDAARQAARTYAYHLWMAPRFNLSDSTLCNKGNLAPRYRGTGQIGIAEEKAPDWRLSEMGLQCEAGGTSTSKHRGVFTANYAGYLLRIGGATQDSFLLDIAKAGVIGRYTSFPGYHINTDRTTVYEKWNFPLRTLAQLTSTSMHYSHIWTQINLMMDYLVSDVSMRTQGAVDFPGEYVQNIVHMQNQVYMQGGTFYGEKGLSLYMPKDFVTPDNKQLNFVSAHGNGKLYIIFTNQSGDAVESTVTVDVARLALNGNRFLVWEENVPANGGMVNGNTFSVKVAPHGVTAVAIENVQVISDFQQKMAVNTKLNRWNKYIQDNIVAGKSKAILLNPSDSLARLFLFSTLPSGTLSSFRVEYSIDGEGWQSVVDDDYPFEYTINLDNASSVEYKIAAGNILSPVYRIERLRPSATLSGWNSVTRSQGANLNITLSGDPPFRVQYIENDKMHTIENILETPYKHLVTPEHTTRYQLMSVLASGGSEGNVSGDAKVVVLDAYDMLKTVVVNKDAHNYSAQPTKNLGMLAQMELKGSLANRRDMYLASDMSDVVLSSGQKVLLGLWLNSTSRVDTDADDVYVSVSRLTQSFEEATLTWVNKPSESERQIIDTVAITSVTPTGRFIYLDVTPLFRQGVMGETTFKVEFAKGNEVASLYFASCQDVLPAKHPHLAVVTEKIAGVEILNIDTEVTVCPTVVSDGFEVKSTTDVMEIKVVNSVGKATFVYDSLTVNTVAWSAGVYYISIRCVDGRQYNKTIIKL